LLLGTLIGLLPQPVAAQDEEECYEPGALRIVMSWTTPFSTGALRIDDPYGNYANSWEGWPENYGPNGPYIEGVGSPFNAIPGSEILLIPTDNDPEFGRGGRIEFNVPDPKQGTYRVRAAVPRAEFNTHLTVEIYASDVMTAPLFSDLRNIPHPNWDDAAFWAWHWEVDEFVICGDKPIVSQVKPKYKIDNTRFLEGIQVVNPIVAHIDWAGLTPDRVEFKLNGDIIASEQTSGNTAEHTLDMGFDLDDDFNRLEIIAYGKDKTNKSRPSDPQLFQFYSIPLPTWLTMLTTQGLLTLPALVGGTKAGATYDMGFQIPVKPFTIDALRIGPPDGKAKFEWRINGGLTIPIDCVSDLSALINASGSKIRFLSADTSLSASGVLKFPRDGACGFDSPVGTAAVKGSYKGKLYSKPVLVMVTYFNVIVGQTVDTIIVVLHLEKFVGKIGEFYIDGSLGVEVNAKLDFAIPAVQDLRLRGDVGLTGGFRSDLKVVEVNVYAGANGAISVVRPGTIDLFILDNWEFDKITLKGEVGAKFRTFWFVREAKGNITWTYPDPAAQMARLADEIESSDWRLIPHPVRPSTGSLQLASNAAFAFATDAQRRAGDAFTGAQTTVTSTLVSNIYPYPDISMAVNPTDDQAIVVWTDVDDAKPLGQAQELFFSRWDGTAWLPPVAVTDDNLLDGAPQVAWASDGHAVALWHRSNTPLAADASLSTTVTQQIDIATAVYSPTTGSWGAVTWLTTNAVLDATPQLARSADGELLAAWRRNSSGLLSGDADAPDQIVAALYQNGWQTPAVAVDNIPGLLEFAVGMGASSALNATAQIAYTQDVTPTGGITPTAQIFLTTWDGNDWSTPQQLTDDEQAHRNLQILYTLKQIPFFPAVNEALLLWLADDQLKVRNLTTETTQTLPLPADILGVDEFRALLDADGNIAVVFVNTTLPRNLYLVYYDEINRLWSTPRPLTDEEHSLKFVSPGFDSTGRLLVAYARTAIAYEEQIIDDEEPITYTIPVERQTDLVTLSHLFDYNLKITDADLAFARSETAENQVVISATVHNDSDKAVRNVRVDFYRGDPAINGVWFDSAFISDPMPGNTHTTVTANYAPWFMPEDIYVTISASSFVESNELDNRARLLGIGADLELVGTEVAYGPNGTASLRSVIRNNGYSDVYEGALVYTLDGAPQPLAQQSVSVTAGETTTVTTALDLTPLPAGVHPMTATVGLTHTTEFTSADNQIVTSLYVLPDLALAVETVAGHEITQTAVTISATVRNIGAAPSVAVPVRFYSAGVLTNDYLLGSEQLASVSADGVHTLTIQVSGPLCQLYAVIDPDNTLDELSRANNVAAILQPAEDCDPQPAPTQRIYLPAINTE
jgi:hypothetical protein